MKNKRRGVLPLRELETTNICKFNHVIKLYTGPVPPPLPHIGIVDDMYVRVNTIVIDW